MKNLESFFNMYNPQQSLTVDFKEEFQASTFTLMVNKLCGPSFIESVFQQDGKWIVRLSKALTPEILNTATAAARRIKSKDDLNKNAKEVTSECGTPPGTRVYAFMSYTDEKISFLGEGTYVGDEIPDDEAQGLSSLLEGRTNPKIVLDDGQVVWGCECYWGDLNDPRWAAMKRSRQLVKVDIDQERMRQRMIAGEFN